MFAGDELSNVYYVKSGYIKMYNVTDNGEQRILLIFPTQYAFPIFPGIMTNPDYRLQYFYQAMTDVELYKLPVPEFSRLVGSNPDAAKLVLEYTTELSTVVIRRLGIIENRDANSKIASLLPYLVKVCGSEVKPGVYKLDLKITHQDIAYLTGLTRETISKEIKKMELEGIVGTKTGGKLTINMKLNPANPVY